MIWATLQCTRWDVGREDSILPSLACTSSLHIYQVCHGVGRCVKIRELFFLQRGGKSQWTVIVEYLKYISVNLLMTISLPRDSMLARYRPMLRPCVCVSVTSRCSTKTARRIELILPRRLPSTYPTLCYKEIRVTPK